MSRFLHLAERLEPRYNIARAAIWRRITAVREKDYTML